MGRPKKDVCKDVFLRLRVTRAFKDYVLQLAKKEECSMTEIIEKAVMKY